jgi:hypothetical protein
MTLLNQLETAATAASKSPDEWWAKDELIKLIGNGVILPRRDVDLVVACSPANILKLISEYRKMAEALKTYENGEYFVIDGKSYEYGEANVDLTQFWPLGTRAKRAIQAFKDMGGEQ